MLARHDARYDAGAECATALPSSQPVVAAPVDERLEVLVEAAVAASVSSHSFPQA